MTHHPRKRERRRSEESRDPYGARANHGCGSGYAPGDPTVLRRAQALLWRDEGESIAEVGERLGVSRRTICYWQAHFRERQAIEITARLGEGHRRGRPRTAAEIIDPLLESVLDQDPRELGYRSTVWTAPLLRQYVEDAHGLGVSRQSVSLPFGHF